MSNADTSHVQINPAIHHVPLTTPKDRMAAILEEVAARHGFAVSVLRGDGSRGRPTNAVSAARRAAVMAVIEARPWWSYFDVARLLNLSEDAVNKHAYRSGHRRRREPAEG